MRLRQNLPKALLTGRSRFSLVVDAAQSALARPELTIDPANRRIQAGGVSLSLAPTQLAFLAWFARRRLEQAPALCCPADGVSEPGYASAYLAEYMKIIGAMGDGDRTQDRLRHGMDKQFFEQTKSKLHRRIGDLLGHAAGPYLISHDGARPRRFSLTLPPEAIRFGRIEG